MNFNIELITRLFVGNLGYLLLVISMMMPGMLLLRIFAVSSGIIGVAYSGFWLNDPVGAFWEGMFALAGVFQISLSFWRNRRTIFSDDERELQAELAPGIEPRHLRELLRIGSWQDAEFNAELTRQNVVTPHLIFLLSGSVAVLINGKRVATCGAGSLIAEIGFASAEPATATVVADQHVRYFTLECNKLRRLMKSNPEIADVINRCKLKHLEKKLVLMNEAMLKTPILGPHYAAQAYCEPPKLSVGVTESPSAAIH